MRFVFLVWNVKFCLINFPACCKAQRPLWEQEDVQVSNLRQGLLRSQETFGGNPQGVLKKEYDWIVLKYFIWLVTSYNWSLKFRENDFYAQQQASTIS